MNENDRGIPVLCYSGGETPDDDEVMSQLEWLRQQADAAVDYMVEHCQSSLQARPDGTLFRVQIFGSLLVTLKELSALVGGSPAVKTLQQNWPGKPSPAGKRGRSHEHVYSYAECIAAWKPEWPSLPPEDEARPPSV